MAFLQLSDSLVPGQLRSVTLVGKPPIPRYWANVWLIMSMRELDRLKVVQAVCERRLEPGQAADRLSLSVRQVERLVQRYQAAGVAGLVNRTDFR